MIVREAIQADAEAWDAYVQAHAGASFYHQYAWRTAIERCYGLNTQYLLAEENQNITGILPLAFVKPLTGGQVLISLPFANYGGVLADRKETSDSLLNKAGVLMKAGNAAYMELKHRIPCEREQTRSKLHYFSLVLTLDTDPDKIWKEKLNTKVRNQVRKAQKSNVEATSGSEYLGDFIRVYQKHMRNLGTPTHKKTWYETLVAEFPGQVDVVVATLNREVIAAALLLKFRNTVIFHSAASNKKYLPLCPNNLVYWKSIELSCEQGFERLDFARSRKDSGTFHFKRQWGAEPEQTHYQYHLNGIDTIPDIDPHNPRYAPATALWKRLPLPLANAFGPIIRKRITT